MYSNRLIEDNDYLLERLNISYERIKKIDGEHINRYAPYFVCVANHIARAIDIYRDRSNLDIKEYNKILYKDILDYDNSYLNPDVTSQLFTEQLGGQYAFLYNELMALIPLAYDNRIDLIAIYAKLFLDIYEIYEEELMGDDCDYDNVAARNRTCIKHFYNEYCDILTMYTVETMLGVDSDTIKNIIEYADLTSDMYLYDYGAMICDNDLKLSRYINSLSESNIDDIAHCFVGGFVKGYEMTGKDISLKSYVKIEYPIGFERVVRRSAALFKEYGLEPIYSRDGIFSFSGGPGSRGAYISSMNKQWIYDHKDDKGYYFDEEFYNCRLEKLTEAYKIYTKEASLFAGPAVIETFGEKDFTPVVKKSAYRFSDEQNVWNVEYTSKASEISNKYMPRESYSYTIIAFPIPEIGPDEFFGEIFDKTMELNTLDYELYQDMQQKIIDILDKADHVHILGQNNNMTDIVVKLHKLSDPDLETNFENCVADVNIPVGEVFTSPLLAGTNGILHVSRVFLNGLAYHDLKITVEDGMVSDYTCSNYKDEAESKRMIYENVMYRHKSLPMGEFAIGTNTLAYKMGREYAIEDKLPILIAEKTGPHFAFGDTCYSHEEDIVTYNPDGKKIIARENECSAKRHEDMSKAYFNCHTDITLPFAELGLIEAVLEDGTSIPIIKDGLFVVDGCDELNKPLKISEHDKMQSQTLYNADDEILVKLRRKAQQQCYEYNNNRADDKLNMDETIRNLMGRIGSDFEIRAPFYCDYGFNIEIGDNFFSNFNLVILDCAKVKIGNNVLIGPNCSICSAGHPTDVDRRNEHLEYAYPIVIEDNVWLGSGVNIMPGVTIGEGSVIGAGSIVIKDIPAHSLAVGNPCKVIRTITDEERLRDWSR